MTVDINERLKKIIDVNGMNLTEFSEVTKIPYRTLQNYVYGKRPLKVDALIKICIQTGVNLNWFLIGEGEMYEKKTIKNMENVETSEKTIKWLNQWWENADERHKHWLEVQMKYYFPDYAAWLAEKENKNN
jgi:transcriptional regulator with XRE-family HTH domain